MSPILPANNCEETFFGSMAHTTGANNQYAVSLGCSKCKVKLFDQKSNRLGF